MGIDAVIFPLGEALAVRIDFRWRVLKNWKL